MKKLKYLSTLLVAAIALVAAWLLWNFYTQSPWTRDGKVRAEQVGITPQVSGSILQLNVADNQQVKAGEVLGVAGLVGAGRTELAKTLYGVFHYDKGTVELDGQQIHPKNPSDAIRNGIYYMTEDRKGDGLVLIMNVKENISLSSSYKNTSSGHINEKKDREYAEDYVKKMRIKTPSVFQKTRNLSGGNQQKVILAKAMMSDPKVLILDEPTRGIDVGAKKEIYLLINELRRQGKAVIMISSEMPEILGMSDRIMILHEGKKKGELSREEATQEKIMDKILS